jgi:predicted dehydrogenase
VYALAREQIASGSIGTIRSIHARRNLKTSTTNEVCKNISALFGDGVHDLDLVFWYTGAHPVSVYAQTMNTRPHLPYDDIGWAMYKLSDGSIAVIETIWCLPDKAPFAIDARMEVIGSEGAIYVENSGGQYTLLTSKGLGYPDAAYWPRVHGATRGYLKEEFDYFLKCIVAGSKPSIITPEESLAAVEGILAAERSAVTGEVVRFS